MHVYVHMCVGAHGNMCGHVSVYACVDCMCECVLMCVCNVYGCTTECVYMCVVAHVCAYVWLHMRVCVYMYVVTHVSVCMYQCAYCVWLHI